MPDGPACLPTARRVDKASGGRLQAAACGSPSRCGAELAVHAVLRPEGTGGGEAGEAQQKRRWGLAVGKQAGIPQWDQIRRGPSCQDLQQRL